jgi:hypothetical protein
MSWFGYGIKGDGTRDNPYGYYTDEELNSMRNLNNPIEIKKSLPPLDRNKLYDARTPAKKLHHWLCGNFDNDFEYVIVKIDNYDVYYFLRKNNCSHNSDILELTSTAYNTPNTYYIFFSKDGTDGTDKLKREITKSEIITIVAVNQNSRLNGGRGRRRRATRRRRVRKSRKTRSRR